MVSTTSATMVGQKPVQAEPEHERQDHDQDRERWDRAPDVGDGNGQLAAATGMADQHTHRQSNRESGQQRQPGELYVLDDPQRDAIGPRPVGGVDEPCGGLDQDVHPLSPESAPMA